MTPRPDEEWTDADVKAFWRERKDLPAVAIVVIVAAAVTLALVVVLADLAFAHVRTMARAELDVGGLRALIGGVIGGTCAVGLAAMWWVWRHRDVSPWTRIAVALVAVHLAIALGAALLSRWLEPVRRTLDLFPVTSVTPATIATLAACGVVIAGAVLDGFVRRRRRGWRTGAPRWLHGTVVFALAFLALLGVWLPISAPSKAPAFWHDPRAYYIDMLPRVLAVPAALALIAGAVATWRPRWLPRLSRWAAPPLASGVAVAVIVRVGASHTALAIYGSFAHLLFAAAAFALCAIAVLAVTHLRALRAHRVDLARPAPWVQRGTVETRDARAPATWIVDGWLGNMRSVVNGFTLRTLRGEALAIPEGTPIVAPVPATTTAAAAGAHFTAVAPGDEVLVSGFVAVDGDGPYRASASPVPGTSGLVVSVPRRVLETADRDLLLVLYRPCLLFLIIAAMAALPALVQKGGGPIDPMSGYYDPP